MLDGSVVYFDEELDARDGDVIDCFLAELGRRIGAVVVKVLLHGRDACFVIGNGRRVIGSGQKT